MKQCAQVYRFGGITFISEIALPELPRAQQPSAATDPVTLRLGEIADHSLEADPEADPEVPQGPLGPRAVELDPDSSATASRYFLRVPGIARYLVTHGKEIVVSPDPAALPLDVRAYLLGSIFVVLYQQRGLLPLHASAVRGNAGVVAFLARSGQGKSSLAAHLARRGFTVMADDVCLVDASPRQPMVIPTAPWLKLWRNSVESLGQQVEGLERVFSEDDKYRLPLAAIDQPDQPEAIHTVIFLEPSSTAIELEEITPFAAIPLLMDLTHHAYVLEQTGQRQEHFLRCSRVSSQARAYRLRRPWGLTHLEATVDLLEKVLLQ